uniref:Ovule protein n=1 Tax=Syphacia muris TaxID=451379 RepID=A0A0N5AN88_9BILA
MYRCYGLKIVNSMVGCSNTDINISISDSSRGITEEDEAGYSELKTFVFQAEMLHSFSCLLRSGTIDYADVSGDLLAADLLTLELAASLSNSDSVDSKL